MNENWQKQAPMLAVLEKENPFSLPSGYFEKLAEQINSQIVINQYDTSNTILELPENYFETLEQQIFSTIKLEKIKENAGSEIFSVPEHYFNTLEDRITSKTPDESKKEPSKVKSFFSTWITLAAAACFIGFIGVGIYLNSNSSDIESQFSQLASDEIVSYLQLYSDAGDAPIILKNLDNKINVSDLNSEISDQDIINYLELNL